MGKRTGLRHRLANILLEHYGGQHCQTQLGVELFFHPTTEDIVIVQKPTDAETHMQPCICRTETHMQMYLHTIKHVAQTGTRKTLGKTMS